MERDQIVADRFLATADGRAIDLVNGAPVLLKIGVGGGSAEQARWVARCDLLHRVRHPAIAALIDFGGLGESQRFEAWRCGGSAGRGDRLARTLQAAERFFAACDLTESLSVDDIHRLDDSCVVAPSAQTGYPMERGDRPKPGWRFETWPLDECGICAIDRRADLALADLFATFGGARPHIVSISGQPGSGCTSAGLRAARVARMHGFVPIGESLVDRVAPGLLEDRQLCVISDECDGPRWSRLLRMVLDWPRPHVILRLGQRRQDPVPPMEAWQGLSLERVPAERLVAAVRPLSVGVSAAERIKRVAEDACGLPGRFAALLWSPQTVRAPSRSTCVRASVRVAEQAAVYGGSDCTSSTADAQPAELSGVWPMPGELASLCRRADAAAALLGKGRHAPAVRQLRQLFGALSRRHDWVHAGKAALMLASALLRRGDARGALAVLNRGEGCLERTGDAGLIDAAIISGQAWIELARLDEAESVIATALAVSRRIGDVPRALSASLALGRCLFWKGRYGDAVSALAAVRGSDASRLLVGALAESARAEIGLGNIRGAVSCAREATEQASHHADSSLVAKAACATAFVHLAAGDFDAVGQDVRRCIAASRAAHDPMMAMRARLLLAESERRRGHPASSFVGRVIRMDAGRLPPLVRARVELLLALTQSSDAEEKAVVVRQVGRLGLPALVLFAPLEKEAPSRSGWWSDSSTADIVGILHLCQTAEDETRVLREICSRIRQQLHAAAVAFFATDSAGFALVAGDGPRMDTAIAARAITGLTIPPHRLDDRLESAAPVRYGGAAIGALAARWTVGTPYDLSHAATVLTMAATASAPVLSASIARQLPATPVLTNLIGTTPGMSDLRRAIERAASAPFAVLIEGESGSGKELVAKAVHRSGIRRDRPFCTLNCAALPDDLVEAELFGHARGAFTGAVHERAGVFEEAHGGTLLLDEVGELSPRAQAKLLRVIQEGELRRIGENASRRVDVRIVAATNRDLRREVADARFRHDLLYRLDVVRLTVPPLRERREDIAILAEHFWREATRRIESRAVLAASTLAALARYDWPGNVRELQNVLAALAVRTPRRGVVTPSALPPQFGEAQTAEACRLDAARRTFDERFVRAALVRCGGHRMRAAAELGVTRQGLTKLLTRLNIS